MFKQQTFKQFKLEISKKDFPVTSFGGLPLLRETIKKMGLADEINNIRLKQGGHEDAVVIEALILLLASGGRSLSDWDYLKNELGFQRMFDCPSVDTLERYLKKISMAAPYRKLCQKGLAGHATEFENLHKHVIKKAYKLANAPSVLTVDIDTTIIESNNREARYTYEKEKGYQPMMAYCPELKMVLAYEFRDGNISPAEGYGRVFARCKKLFSKVRWVLRSDSAGYQKKLMDSLMGEGAGKGIYYITARQCDFMTKMIDTEEGWQPIVIDNIVHESEVTTLAYAGTFSGKSELKQRRGQRHIVIRRKLVQGDLWAGSYSYQVIATNDPSEDLSSIIKNHRGRCGSIELANSEIKSGCGMDQMPSNTFSANCGWFSLGVLTHNLLKLIQQHILPESLKKVEIKTLRFRFIRMAAVIIKKARHVIIRLNKNNPINLIYYESWDKLKALPH